jgi:dipeptidyl aminopeptidase/acylaminoacyl peptidase
MKRVLLLLLLLFAASAQAELPALIPREVLFGNPQRTDPQISPDGSQLSWLAPDKNGVLNVWVSGIERASPHPVTNEPGYPIHYYRWAADGKRILYLHDNNGDEIDHLFSADLTSGNVRDLTPFRGVCAQNVLTDSGLGVAPGRAQPPRSRSFRHVSGRSRDRRVALEATNPGDVLTWRTDSDFVIRAATAFEGKQVTIIRVRDAADKPWRDLVVMPFERALLLGKPSTARSSRASIPTVRPAHCLGVAF